MVVAARSAAKVLLWRRLSAMSLQGKAVRGLSPKAVCSDERRGCLYVSFDCDLLSEELEEGKSWLERWDFVKFAARELAERKLGRLCRAQSLTCRRAVREFAIDIFQRKAEQAATWLLQQL